MLSELSLLEVDIGIAHTPHSSFWFRRVLLVKKDLHVATVSTYKCEKEVSFCQMNPTVLLVKKKAMALQMKMKLPFYL